MDICILTAYMFSILEVMSVIEKLDRKCVLHLPPPEMETVRIVVNPDVSGTVACYTVFNRVEWFESYRIESQNANQIGLELECGHLVKTLRSCSAADEIVVRLSKKGGPVLTFEIHTAMGPIMQDIPVAVLSAVRLAECSEPNNETVTGFTLPNLAVMHPVIERMKGLGNDLVMNAEIGEDKAHLSLELRTDMVTVTNVYKNLNRASFGTEGRGQSEPVDEPEGEVIKRSACIDRRNLSRCMYGHIIQPKHAICFLFHNSVMVHLLGAWGVTLTYYLPKRFPN